MATLSEVYVEVKPDTDKVTRTMKSQGAVAGRRFGDGFRDTVKTAIGNSMSTALDSVIRGAGRAIKTIVLAGVDLAETTNKARVIFGKNFGQIQKFADGAATSVGLSKQAALEATSGFGDMFTQIGFGAKQAADMSVKTVKLAADLGSFSNLDTADVNERIAAAFRGEYDSLQQVIPAINAARVQKEAMAATGKKNAQALTEEEKAAAVLAIIQKDGKKAAGDFAKTQGSVANQAKTAKAQLINMAGTIGTALDPVLRKVMGFITGTVLPGLSKRLPGAIETVKSAFRTADLAIKAFFAAFREGDVTSDGVVGVFEQLGVAARKLQPTLQAVGNFIKTTIVPALRQLGQFIITTVVPAWLDWQVFMAGQLFPILKQLGGFFVANIIPALKAVVGFIITQVVPGFLQIVSTIKGLYAVIFPIVSQIVGVIIGKFQEMLPQIQEAWGYIKEIITGAMFIIKTVIQNVTQTISTFWARWGDTIKSVVGTVFGLVINIIKSALKIVAGIIKLAVALIKGDWKGAWTAIKQIFSGVWDAIKSILSAAWNIVKAIFAREIAWVKNKWNGFWSGVKTVASNAMTWVKDKISTVLGKIKDAFRSAKDSIKRTWEGVKSAVSNPIEWVKNNVYNKPLVPVWNKVADLVNGPKLSTYARGGIEGESRIRPGYTPGRDTHMIGVGGGEAIMRPEWTRAVGPQYVHAANRAARQGVHKAKEFMEGTMQGFAGGGIVGWAKGVVGNVVSKVGDMKDWALGGLRNLAGKLLGPVKGLIDKAMPSSGVGNTVGGIGKKAIDLVLDKIKSADEAAMASVGQGAYTGPPGTGSRGLTTWHGGRFTQRFRNTLEEAQRYARTFINVIQGGFRPRTSYSGTSHAGDAIDTSWRSSVLSGLRRAGVAAWHRTPAQGFSHHIHGVPLPGRGFAGGSGIWQAQDYLRGGNGLENGGLVAGGRGGLITAIGEGRHDELVTPLPKNWKTQAERGIAGGVSGRMRPIKIELNLGEDLRYIIQGVIDDNDEFHETIGRLSR